MRMSLADNINKLRKERDALILSHTYQPPEIQDIADFVGDSYGLSKRAAEVDKELIVFCGVKFMAETAAILNPGRTVLLPDMNAGCPMADMITADELRQLKAKHPDAAVVCYVNSTAEVKAESTVCCTSSNAVQIVNSLRDAPEIIFVPDQYLGKFVERQTGRSMILWDGYCPTHAAVQVDTLKRMRTLHPGAEVMVHPECPPDVQDEADHILSTGQMCELVVETSCRQFIVGTEQGIIHTLKKIAPQIDFISLSPLLLCPNMKKITLSKIERALESSSPAVVVPPEIAQRARKAVEAMLETVEGSSK
ncbi:MAG: quinolinate synthase NadA [Lentisphaeria bacterium]